MGKIIVVGSINMDMVISADKMPIAGETIVGNGFFTNAGGKGANQAVACSKMGCQTFLVGAVGNDLFGKECLESLCRYGVNAESVQTVKNCNTGLAVIVVVNGDNRIILDGGANEKLDKERIYDVLCEKINKDDIVVCQFELPLDCVGECLKIAKEKGAVTILNPAPAKTADLSFLRNTDVIIPNETEANVLSGIKIGSKESLKNAVGFFRKMGVKDTIITLGEKGCYYNGKIYEAKKVSNVVDTTAAGDTFIGAFAYQLSVGKCIEDSIEFCQKACALKITRKGAQVGIPYLKEITEVQD